MKQGKVKGKRPYEPATIRTDNFPEADVICSSVGVDYDWGVGDNVFGQGF